MNKPKRNLKQIDVNFISLVRKGANGKSIIYKSANSTQPTFSKTIPIIKTDEEKRLVYGTVYEPDVVDSQGDVASADVIERAAHAFLEKLHNKNVDVQHDYKPDEGSVVESFILRAADPMFPDTKVGAWVVAIKVANDETWEMVKKGEITGLSLAGLAVAEVVEKHDSADGSDKNADFPTRVKKAFAILFGVEKDFNAELKAVELNQKVWALQDAIRKVMNDEGLTTELKQEKVLESIDQFRASVVEEPIKKNTNEVAMKIEDVQKVVNDAVKTVSEQVMKLESELKAVTDRVEKVEKSSPGSAQVRGTEKQDTPRFWT